MAKKIVHEAHFYGVATVGERGQVVIPSDARKDLKLGTGDKMLVMKGAVGDALVFVKANEMGKFLGKMSDMIGEIREELGG